MHVIIYPECLIEAVAGLPTPGHLRHLLGEVVDAHPIDTADGPAVVWTGPTGTVINPCAAHLLARYHQPRPVTGTAVICGWDPLTGAPLALTGHQVLELTRPYDHPGP